MANIQLKIAIIQSGWKGYQVAHKLHWHPTKVSQIVIGAHKPSKQKRRDLAGILGKKEADLFPKPHPSVNQ